MQLNVMGSSIVVLNTMEAITDLMEKRGSLYSDRAAFTMASLIGFDTVRFSAFRNDVN
jgi:hypothetical protein